MAFQQPRLGIEVVFDWSIRGKPGASELKRYAAARGQCQPRSIGCRHCANDSTRSTGRPIDDPPKRCYTALSTPAIDSPVEAKIVRFPDCSPASVCSAHEGTIDPDDLRRIVEICSEPEIYDTLFRRMLRSEPYTLSNAESFRDMCYLGWRKKELFVFLIRDKDHELIGVMDIKAPRDGAEIGYWVSNTAPGYMTNAVSLLLQLAARAGYRSLAAVTLVTNVRSQRLLRRVGFEQTRIETEKGIDWTFFERRLETIDANDC